MNTPSAKGASPITHHSSLIIPLLALGGGSLLAAWIGAVPLLDADEPRFAECSRQMLVTGDWMYPQFNGRPRHAKPPLSNWVQATLYRLGGVNEITARLPSVIATVATGLLVCWFAGMWRGRGTGVMALATWFALPQTHFWAKMSVVDPLLTLLISAALVTAFCGVEASGGARWNWYLPCGLAMGLATMAKGPVGLVVPTFAYVLYVLLSKQVRKGLWHPGPWVALLIALAVAGPWFYAQIAYYGQSYIKTFIMGHNVERYARARDSLGPIGWLWPIPVVMVFAFPAAILLPRGVGDAFRGLRRAWAGEAEAKWRLFAAIWLLSVALLFAPCATRLPQYFMALYPAAALLAADLLARLLLGEAGGGRRWPVALGYLVVGLSLGGGFGYGATTAADWAPKLHLDNVPLMSAVAGTMAAAFALGGIVCAATWVWGKARTATVGLLAMGLLTAVAMSDVVWPMVGITRDQGLKEAGLICRQGLAPDAPVVTYRLHTSTIAFYSRRLYLEVEKRQPEIAMALLRAHPGAWLLTHQRYLPDLPGAELEVIAARRQYVLARPRLAEATRHPEAPSRGEPGTEQRNDQR